MNPSSETLEARPRPGIAHGYTVGIVTFLTLLVSIFGYVREATLAARFGVSATMDAYFGAILIPNTLYLILVVGTLSPIFIPILLEEDISGDRAKVSETFSVMANFTLICVSVIVALSLLTARQWLPWLFPGFGSGTSTMLLRLVYIIYPGVVFLAMAGILTALLNGFHKFALAAFMPAVASVGVILAALLARGSRAIYIVGVATSIGFLLQFLFLLPAAASLRIGYRPIFNLRHPAIRKLIKLGGPLFVYLVVSSISSIVERNLASRLSSGAVSAVTYAMRLFAVPANFLAAPLAIVSYPLFAREALKGSSGNLLSHVSRTLRFVVVIFVPVTFLVILNALPLTRVLYERGKFLGQDSLLISRLLMIYGVGILPNAVAIILLRCFFALQDTLTPLIAEAVNLAMYVVFATWLINHYGIAGLAIARGISFFLVAAIFVFVLWNRREILRLDLSFWSLFARTAAASLCMAAVNWMGWHFLQSSFDSVRTPLRLSLLCCVAIASGASFVGVARLLKVAEVSTVVRTGAGLIQTNWNRAFQYLGT